MIQRYRTFFNLAIRAKNHAVRVTGITNSRKDALGLIGMLQSDMIQIRNML